MVVDLSFGAKENKKFVQDWWVTKGRADPASAVAVMANATGVQCINIAFWIAEVEGYPRWLKQKVAVLVQFYGYSSIVYEPENCPWQLRIL